MEVSLSALFRNITTADFHEQPSARVKEVVPHPSNITTAETQVKLEEMKREQMQSFAERRLRSLENAEQMYYQNMHLGSRNIGSPQASTSTTIGVFVPRNMPRYECYYDKDPLNRSGEQRSEDLVDTPSDPMMC